jgi:dTDP-4-amino-4,6-dideoxygalactose transaminase
VGATPVFADIEPDSFNLDPDSVAAAITGRTVAIMPVHLYGLPAAMGRILPLVRRYGLALVEDAAQAHAAAVDGQPVGTFGEAGCFSFYPTKNVHALEGGMISTADAGLARTLRLLRNQGMEQRYQNEIVGANMRLTDVAAAVGRAQLARLAEWTEQRRANAAYLDRNLTGVRTPRVPAGYRHVYHQYTIRVSGDRDAFRVGLEQRGIGSAVYYPTPIHRLRPYLSETGEVRGWKLPETDRAAAQVLSLPVFPALTFPQLDRIVEAVNTVAMTA